MRFRRRRRTSGDIIDRRYSGSGLGGLPMAGKLGVPGLIAVIAVVLLSNVLGGEGASVDVDDVLGQLGGGNLAPAESPPPGQDPDQRLVEFMSFVLDDAQNTWEQVFRDSGKRYERAELVLFEGSTNSACGGATEQIGPHYCPPDQRMYLDLDFFRELRNRFGAPGDFAQAYVLAHEVAHHVQNLLGINGEVHRESQRDPDQANELSVRLELQADCFAGVWAFTTYERDLLESGDLEEGLNAAAAVGDDRIQKEATGRIDPESWTHGSSEQRMAWFQKGFDTGDPAQCDTFSADEL